MIKQYIFLTSDQGYTQEYWKVNTNIDLEDLHKLELSKGPIGLGRYSSTNIEDLQRYSKEEGYLFEYKEVGSCCFDGGVDYTAIYGNY